MTLAQIEAWLESLHTTLWGTFNVQDPVQRRQAAEWFAQQVNECKATSHEWHYQHSILWGGADPGAHATHGMPDRGLERRN